jgi:LPXTG-site transpeptidase (sortase) family protein
MEKRKIKDLCVIIGLLLFSIFSFISVYYIGINNNTNKKEEDKIEEFFEKQEEYVTEITEKEQISEEKENEEANYTMILEIPKISLKRGIFSIGLLSNTVSKNVQLIEGTDMPDKDNGNVILASHRGNSRVSYFNKLDTLSIGDKIYLYYNGTKYEYELNNSYVIDKTGTAEINRDYSKSTITLITCKKNTNDKQVVYIGYLKNTSNY